MKSIKAFLGGEQSDESVLCAALAAAKPLAAHIECIHVRLGTLEAAAFTPHMDFATGTAISDGLDSIEAEAAARSRGAMGHFERFAGQHRIDKRERPASSDGVSMSYRQPDNGSADCILHEARYCDLVVMARSSYANGLPDNLAEQVLMRSGHPLLLAPVRPPETLTGTVLLFWKDTASSARAINASMPLLHISGRVVIVGCEDTDSSPDGLQLLKQQLAWNGVAAETEWCPGLQSDLPHRLDAIALRNDADLLVMGAYSRSRMGETLFGGCTLEFLRHSAFPVLLMH